MDHRTIDNATAATGFLKAIANENRLLILCHLAGGEKSVGKLESLIGIRQPTLSQQLARLREAELVTTRREAKTVHYSLASDAVRRVIRLLDGMYGEGSAAAGASDRIDRPAGNEAPNPADA